MSRVTIWRPDPKYPGYVTRLNEDGHRETKPDPMAKYAPKGYRRLDAEVWIGSNDVVVVGTPDESEDEETGHNCDAMGCGWDHVLYRIPLPSTAGPLRPAEDRKDAQTSDEIDGFEGSAKSE